MKKTTNRKVVTACMLALTLGAGALLADRQVEESLPATANARVHVGTVAGSVRVVGWGEERVAVSGTLGDDVERLEVTGEPGHVTVEVKIPQSRWVGRKDISADLEIRVPAGCRLEVNAVSASIDVTGVTGEADLEAVSGSVSLDGDLERAELNAVSGSITAKGSGRALEAEAVSGGVSARGAWRNIDASTVSGRIDVATEVAESARFEAVSGSIRFEGGLAAEGRVDVDGHSSNVTLILPPEVSATFRVDTFSGRIDNDFGPDGERASRYGPGRKLTFTAGSGDARVSVDTFSGNVRLARR